MIFSGYVQLRRGLLEHLQDGRLTLLEYSVLTALIILADKATGSGTINANTLAAFVGDDLDYASDVPRNRQRGKQRILKNLEAKGYIYRQIVPHSKRAYRFWVNKYLVTDGPHKSRRVDLSQVFESQDVTKIQFVSTVAEGVAETVAETVASNKKREKKLEKTSLTTVSASMNDSVNASMSETETASAKHTVDEACALHGVRHGVHHVFDTHIGKPEAKPGTYVDPELGRPLTEVEIVRRNIALMRQQPKQEGGHQ